VDKRGKTYYYRDYDWYVMLSPEGKPIWKVKPDVEELRRKIETKKEGDSEVQDVTTDIPSGSVSTDETIVLSTYYHSMLQNTTSQQRVNDLQRQIHQFDLEIIENEKHKAWQKRKKEGIVPLQQMLSEAQKSLILTNAQTEEAWTKWKHQLIREENRRRRLVYRRDSPVLIRLLQEIRRANQRAAN